ncbi:unnamed protein product [Rotaria socialis]|uniref:Uncharacterized protein n=3 Tax=Rotaria socialis TaxID=392032 RepID=A0A820HKN5_9BILA|nr:unnamed protein product [Rotaria socialis]CAF3333061.1 unnamed protein product [Rotaria socialis]CAF3424725.1 unnamed protein product [Rotaria socialis]CAF3549748.1 unnamed protein product [Rotaria socialis]CAF3707348.1 unnamed protein product [Rotaria socialis]
MLFIIITTVLLATIKISHTDGIKTTFPVSIIFDGFTLHTWIDQSLWNKTRQSVVHHLNEFCKKDFNCDAEYGAGNVHLISAVQHGLSSVHLNITADEPVLLANGKVSQTSLSYNYTALLTSALFQAKIDIEHLNDDQPLYLSSPLNPNLMVSRTSRLLFVLLGITLVAIVFGSTVFFFQRIRRHNYSILIKNARMCQPMQDEPLTCTPSMSGLHP